MIKALIKSCFTTAFVFLFASLVAQPTIDGNMSDMDYSTIGTYTSGNDGFGGDNDLGEIKFYSTGTDIYIGITGEVTSNDNIILFFNFSGYGGRAAGSTLGAGGTGVFTSIGGAAMDFDTDFALAFNEASSTTDFFVDAARYGTSGFISDGNLGNVGAQDGTSMSFAAGGVFGGTGSITVAYNSDFAGSTDNGVEFSIPIAAFAGVSNMQTLQVFAVISNSIGFFSNECIPGDPGGTNPGIGFNWNGVVGQDFFTSAQSLPVEYLGFNAIKKDRQVELNWQTAIEENNSHFEVESSVDGRNFQNIGNVQGQGNSMEVQSYSFVDDNPNAGTNYYRLKQVDFNGNYSFSEMVSVEFKVIKGTVYPNPVRSELIIELEEDFTGNLELFNAHGQLVQHYWMEANNKWQQDISTLSTGIYWVRLISTEGNVVLTEQILKQ